MATGRKASAEPSFGSSVLVTSAVAGVRDCGSGFCVRSNATESFVVTCDHVVNDLDPGTGTLRVDGFAAREVASGGEDGVDLSVLLVDRVLPSVEIGGEPRTNAKVSGVGYCHLHGNHYVSHRFSGKIVELIAMRRQLSQSSFDSFLVKADKGSKFVPGNSGSALCDVATGKVIGILAFASRDGAEGYAIAASAVHVLMPALLPHVAGAAAQTSDRRSPPPLGPVTDPEDLQHGRFGGKSHDDKVKLSAKVLREVKDRYFVFDARVVPTDKNLKLTGPARFYLHDTYPRSLIEIRKPDDEDGGFSLREVHSYGVYTLGCQVLDEHGDWHSLEFDLSELGEGDPKLSESFLNR